MLTAMQGARLRLCNELVAALNILIGNQSLICLSTADRADLKQAASLIDGVLKAHAPSNEGVA